MTQCRSGCGQGVSNSPINILCFFFSSRRRHTRFDCDWSSDVCSSDLEYWNISPNLLVGCIVPSVRSADRKSTRLNSSHSQISYAVFCLKKKKKKKKHLNN